MFLLIIFTKQLIKLMRAREKEINRGETKVSFAWCAILTSQLATVDSHESHYAFTHVYCCTKRRVSKAFFLHMISIDVSFPPFRSFASATLRGIAFGVAARITEIAKHREMPGRDT